MWGGKDGSRAAYRFNISDIADLPRSARYLPHAETFSTSRGHVAVAFYKNLRNRRLPFSPPPSRELLAMEIFRFVFHFYFSKGNISYHILSLHTPTISRVSPLFLFCFCLKQKKNVFMINKKMKQQQQVHTRSFNRIHFFLFYFLFTSVRYFISLKVVIFKKLKNRFITSASLLNDSLLCLFKSGILSIFFLTAVVRQN